MPMCNLFVLIDGWVHVYLFDYACVYFDGHMFLSICIHVSEYAPTHAYVDGDYGHVDI